ncbi:ubiquitin--protein ligase [Onchocerca flexuosa]|uniref:Ubiquitin--protein ligase n=1 Tax=Onchocerca flexuosa TaxID=387005 RepID=A0A238C056_9BILA|nr:ubiquitin--protein ligase [Onchocerca flexuosa]
MMGTMVSSPSSPEPEEILTTTESLLITLSQKPLRMSNMLRMIRIISDCSPEEKLQLFHAGVLRRICETIAEYGGINKLDRPEFVQNRRRIRQQSAGRNSFSVHIQKGIGYGYGSTRSRWNIERTVEERLIREEHLVWLLNAVTAFIYCASPDFSSDVHLHFIDRYPVHLSKPIVRVIGESAIIPLLEYHLNNDSIFDVSEHVELYQVVVAAAHRYEQGIPIEKRVQTAAIRTEDSETLLMGRCDEEISTERENLSILYHKTLKKIQVQTFRFIGDYGKLSVPFTFKKEVRNVNPFSASLKERTRRIARELASMPNSLPLNASNSIFVCLDEGRCDIVKVLISGPDDTPYQNGLFEFDVFFPTSYPLSPPKCAFLTTGEGNVRFNPNLYSDGKICLSILGTWEGRPEEKWNAHCSLLQILISIQGLIFVKEPYFNEPGFEKYQGTEKGDDFSKHYNLQIEYATLTYAIREQVKKSPPYFKDVIKRHFWLKRHSVIEQAQNWLGKMTKYAAQTEKHSQKNFLLPFETATNFLTQERMIYQIIEDFQKMTYNDT